MSKIDITQDEKIKNGVYYYLALIEFKLGYYDKSIKLVDKINKEAIQPYREEKITFQENKSLFHGKRGDTFS